MAYKDVTSGGVWDWEQNETFEGYLRSTEEATGQNKKPYTIFHMEDMKTSAEYKMWGAVLESKLSEVPIGSQVKIDYKGKARGKAGNQYSDFGVQVWEA